MKTNLFIFVLMAICLSGCSSIIRVYSEAEPGANLYRYHTYQWRADILPGASNVYLSREAAGQIQAAVDRQMAAYGYKICTEKPDLMLHYHVVVENKVYFQHDWNCGDEGRPGAGMCHRVNPAYFREGTLMLDLIDTQNGHQVWRGVAVGILENATPEQRGKLIEEAVEKIFNKFPEKKWPLAVK